MSIASAAAAALSDGAGILVNEADLEGAPPAVRDYLLGLLRRGRAADTAASAAPQATDATEHRAGTGTGTAHNDTPKDGEVVAGGSNRAATSAVAKEISGAITTTITAASAAAPPTPAPSSDDGVAATDPQAGFKTLARQVADMTAELSLLRAETKMLREAMVEYGVLRVGSRAATETAGEVVSTSAATAATATATATATAFTATSIQSRPVTPPSLLRARTHEAEQREALEAWGYAAAGVRPDDQGRLPPFGLDGDMCFSPGPPPFSPLSDIATPRTPDRLEGVDVMAAAEASVAERVVGSPLSEPDEHVEESLLQPPPDITPQPSRATPPAQPRQPEVTSTPRPATGTFGAKPPAVAAATVPAAPGSRSSNIAADAIFSNEQFDLDPDSSPIVVHGNSVLAASSVGAPQTARVVRELQPRPATPKTHRNVEYEWKPGQGGDVLLLKPTPAQYADLKGHQEGCPLLFLCAEELGARHHGVFIIEVPEVSRPAIPEQKPRESRCTVYKQQKLASGFWRLYTSSGRRTIPPPGAFEPISLTAATREFEKRLTVGKTLQRVAYETDIPAHTPEERREALLPDESPVYPLRGNKLEPEGIPGIHTPSAYRGTACAPFAWHFEDLKLGAINCLYRGQKVWFVTEPASFDAASKVFGEITKKAVDHDQFLRHDALHYGVYHLRSKGIVTRGFMQDAWQMVAVYPGAYHSGFSATATLAEAVNYADYWWTAPEGYRPCTERCHPGREPITLEQLIPGERPQSPVHQQSPTSITAKPSIEVRAKPLAPAARTMGRVSVAGSRKTSLGKRSGSARSSVVSVAESVGEPPPKRTKGHGGPPTLEMLAAELTGPLAERRLRSHMLACTRHQLILLQPWDDGIDWAQQTNEYINLGNDMKRKAYSVAPLAFAKLVGLAFRTRAVESIHDRAQSMVGSALSDTKPLPKHAMEQIRQSLGIEGQSHTFKFWVAAQRKFMRLGVGYLPLLPLDSQGEAAFRDYERLGNKEIETVRAILDRDPRAKGLARAGRALMDRILGKESFVWERISDADLERLDDDALLSLLPVRQLEQNELDGAWEPPREMPELNSPDAVQGRQCELCRREEACSCISNCFAQEPRACYVGPGRGLGLRAAAAYKSGDLLGEVVGRIVPPGTVQGVGGSPAVDFVRGGASPSSSSSSSVPYVVGQIDASEAGNVFRLLRQRCGDDAEARLVPMVISGRWRMVVVANRDMGEGDEISSVKAPRRSESCTCSDCSSSCIVSSGGR